MGYTSFTVEKLQGLIDNYNPESVIDLGAQNLYNQPAIPAPYASKWYAELGIKYTAIDLCMENGSLPIDLSMPLKEIIPAVNLLVDAGTSEHVRGSDDKFSWRAIYNCWRTKHDLLKVGGVMYSENPKTGNWPLHGQNYYTQEFYTELGRVSGYEILEVGEHAACNNFVDGWNIFCSMKKVSEQFPSFETFSTLPLHNK